MGGEGGGGAEEEGKWERTGQGEDILNNAFYRRSKCMWMKFRGEMEGGRERDHVKGKERGDCLKDKPASKQ